MYVFLFSRNRTRLGRQKLPKVEKRPTTKPQPFSFAACEEGSGKESKDFVIEIIK